MKTSAVRLTLRACESWGQNLFPPHSYHLCKQPMTSAKEQVGPGGTETSSFPENSIPLTVAVIFGEMFIIFH